jgi:hypothetical protein
MNPLTLFGSSFSPRELRRQENMMTCIAATVSTQQSIVYDVNGNEVGTVEEIFGASTDESTSPFEQTSRPDAE